MTATLLRLYNRVYLVTSRRKRRRGVTRTCICGNIKYLTFGTSDLSRLCRNVGTTMSVDRTNVDKVKLELCGWPPRKNSNVVTRVSFIYGCEMTAHPYFHVCPRRNRRWKMYKRLSETLSRNCLNDFRLGRNGSSEAALSARTLRINNN